MSGSLTTILFAKFIKLLLAARLTKAISSLINFEYISLTTVLSAVLIPAAADPEINHACNKQL